MPEQRRLIKLRQLHGINGLKIFAVFTFSSAPQGDIIFVCLAYGGGEISAVLSIHAYSQLLMPPWATGRADGLPNEPPTIEYMTSVSNKMASKIEETHGKVYSVGQSRDVVGYPAGGTTEDYAYDSDIGLGFHIVSQKT